MSDSFWAAIGTQLDELTRARSAADVLRILSHANNPLDSRDVADSAAQGFFAGSGGDGTVREALDEAGWTIVWSQSAYYYAMRAPDDSVITYIEGDIYLGDRRSTAG
jgi:hypothetical protein